MNILKKAMLKIASTMKIRWRCAGKGTKMALLPASPSPLASTGPRWGSWANPHFHLWGLWDCWPEISLNPLPKPRHLKGTPREGQTAVSATSGVFLCVGLNVGTFTGCSRYKILCPTTIVEYWAFPVLYKQELFACWDCNVFWSWMPCLLYWRFHFTLKLKCIFYNLYY